MECSTLLLKEQNLKYWLILLYFLVVPIFINIFYLLIEKSEFNDFRNRGERIRNKPTTIKNSFSTVRE